MDILKKFVAYLKTNHLWVKLKYGNNQDFDPKQISEPIVKELKVLQFKESPTAFEITNPQEISNPVKQAVENLKFPEPIPYPTETSINNPGDITNPLSERLKSIEGAIRDGREVVIKNDLSQLLGLFKSNKDKGDLLKVLKEIRDKETENVDYTLLISDLITAIENKNIDLSKIEKLLADLNKEPEKFPEYFKLDKYQLSQLIPLSMMHAKHLNKAGAQVNPATEEKQDALITAVSTYNEAYGKGELSGDYYYWGYQIQGGTAWRIKRWHATTKAIEWATGASGLATAWADKENQSYSSTL